MPTLAAAVLQSFAEALFRANKVPPDEAERVARSLVDANLCGHDSHGVIRVPQYVEAIRDKRVRPGAAFTVVKETAAVLVVDGGWGLGQVQAHRLLERLVPRAQALGLAAGTLKHCGHIGRLGEFAEAAAVHKMAFFATVNNHGFGRGVAPPGGIEPRLGTNPLCLGAPTNGEPAIVDIGTSVVAEGKIRVAYNKGQKVPEGWLLDAEGKPTTDPGVLYKDPRGTILPLGGAQAYKGFGISLLLDMFAGGLSGAPCSTPGAPSLSANAVVFLVLDIAQFAGAAHFLKEVTQLTENVRACPRAAGVQEILLPGDPERREKAKRLQSGIPLDDGTWGQLCKLAQELNVSLP
ncbi:MAG: Ldh family oxidoreductase [Gemmataceae bacterium]|nr:Ldh family oxidoreductase [Gemmataceae bacterium]MCI0738072.1 Ldh family oxidoreductase [Gemmataceae bacterium]